MIVLPKNTQRNGKINLAYEDSIYAVGADDLLDSLHRLFGFNNRDAEDNFIRGLEILTGVKAEGQYGESQAGDNENYKFGLAAGFKLFDDRAHLLLSAETYNNKGMLRSDRAATRANYVYVGSTPGGGAPVDAIAFGMGAAPIARGAQVRAAFQIGLDSYFGEERVQLKVKDVKT